MCGITVKHLPKGWFARPSPMALGINRTLCWVRVLITWGLELTWSIALVMELHISLYEVVAFDFTGFVNPVFVRLLLLGERICIAVARFRACLR